MPPAPDELEPLRRTLEALQQEVARLREAVETQAALLHRLAPPPAAAGTSPAAPAPGPHPGARECPACGARVEEAEDLQAGLCSWCGGALPPTS